MCVFCQSNIRNKMHSVGVILCFHYDLVLAEFESSKSCYFNES